MIPSPPELKETDASPPRSRFAAAATIVAVFLVFVAAVVIGGVRNNRVAADQDVFHLPVIRQFVAQWPRPDLSNYASATSPGYHLLLAAVSTYASDNLIVLRVVGGLFGVAFIGVLAGAAAPRSAWLALPAAASVYVLTSTVWLLPENAGWLFVAIALLLAMHATGGRLFVGSAVTFAILVFVRQSHAWVMLPFIAGALSDPLSRYAGGGLERGSAYSFKSREDPLPNPPPAYRERGQMPRLIVFTIITLLPAFTVLAYLVYLWHGLTPPAFRAGSGVDLPLATKAGGFAPAAPAMLLSLIGLFGTPLLAWLVPTGDTRRAVRWIMIGLAVGLVLGLLPVTTYSIDRRSGIWNVVEKLPTFYDRSPLIVGLSTLGGAVAAATLLRLPTRQRFVLAAALVGFTIVQLTNAAVWQRYYEPFALLWLILAAGVPTSMPAWRRWPAIIGLALLTLFQLAVTLYVLRSGG